ncbi:30S ribosomal protein S16 [Candidatus Shapirobacteria bacterium CG08_land_8_20_14_0_20_39_18]|uniref:30S ribosomal protein S16 n=1 Tax=Candidatus Shapirobacteria bacterium CG08_land_8_20_14_0_20_39_18 TaxID=1974883 RepID=A0A2M6XD32_9BACT|nr:MAG: 30S ribosomal protein S16 [Candidatus Shapirobacteria bacterium CG08_land_8_20_14_0_20_39_18]PIY66127.1 MAG: 30S ribosomal protein S16 [Candidatus Shapirobacteria bacterium CG_4_10_14_0_8_um_filter_39_15]PJE68514.1 MAG: 30S ribosomal protein S16 [Candidatus Shapirobacteria bacterium CG10_big_fil_rev_8_21_14_0_10_38_8]
MGLRIHLSKSGRHGQKVYRIIISEKDGQAKDYLGFYAPKKENPEFSINKKLYQEWISKGALPSETLKKLVEKTK